MKNITDIEIQFEKDIDAYLHSRYWISRNCDVCGNQFYSKNKDTSCGSLYCEGEYNFLSKPKRKKPLFLDELFNSTKDFFKNNNYEIVKGIGPVNEYVSNKDYNIRNLEDPLFTTSGVSVLYDSIFNEKDKYQKEIFIAQPSIRTQFFDDIGKRDGFSTSFVNISTEEINPDIMRHIKHLDNWLTYFSSAGLFVNDMKLSKRHDTPDWGKGQFQNIIVDINYGGLQLGDAVLAYDIPQNSRNNLSISDIGFGLERVCWALNKTKSYFDIIGPLPDSLIKSPTLIDTARTLTLMAGGGVDPSKIEQGYRFRQFSKRLVSEKENYDFENLTSYYYNFWNKFIDLNRTLDDSRKIIRKECNRNLNIGLCESLNIKPNSLGDVANSFEHNDFVKFLIKSNRNVTMDKIRESSLTKSYPLVLFPQKEDMV